MFLAFNRSEGGIIEKTTSSRFSVKTLNSNRSFAEESKDNPNGNQRSIPVFVRE